MREKKNHLYVDSRERSILLHSLVELKNQLIQQGRYTDGVDLLPSNIELSGLEVRLINAISRESVLKTCINEVKKNYDVVLVDCMPSLGMLTINALAAADSERTSYCHDKQTAGCEISGKSLCIPFG